MLPHRYPFLLIDRVLELEPLKRCVAVKNVSVNEPQFAGHFPEVPIMPGVLILEAMAQAGILMIKCVPRYADSLGVFTGIDNVKFRKPVLPGDQLVIEVTMTKLRRIVGRVEATARVDGEIVCTAEFGFALANAGFPYETGTSGDE